MMDHQLKSGLLSQHFVTQCDVGQWSSYVESLAKFFGHGLYPYVVGGQGGLLGMGAIPSLYIYIQYYVDNLRSDMG